jgi:hypothetical protein
MVATATQPLGFLKASRSRDTVIGVPRLRGEMQNWVLAFPGKALRCRARGGVEEW